jgi:hypothetical protein
VSGAARRTENPAAAGGLLDKARDSPCRWTRLNAATIFRWMKRVSPRLASERAYIICGFPVTTTIRPNAWRSRAGSLRQPGNSVPAHRRMKLGCLVWTFGALPASPARRLTCEPAGGGPARPGWSTAGFRPAPRPAQSPRRVTICRSRMGKSTRALRNDSLQLEPRARNEIPELLAIWTGL